MKIFIILVIIFYLLIQYYDNKIHKDYLNGYFEGTIGDKENSNVVLFFNKNKKTGHLAITDGDEIKENSPFNFTLSKSNTSLNYYPFTGLVNGFIEYNIYFTNLDDKKNNEFVFNEKTYKILVSIQDGTIILYNNKHNLFKLYKNNYVSCLSNLLIEMNNEE